MKTFCRVALAALCLSFFDSPARCSPRSNIRTGRFASSSASRRAAATTSSRASFGQKLSESLGQPVIIENKPGAGAILATEYVARSAPDGYTLLVGASGAMVINPAVYEKLNYDTMRDFKPVSELGSFPLILIVNAKSPFKSLADLVAYAKANPDKANYSSFLRRLPARDRAVQAEDRRADADDPLQGGQRFRYRCHLGRSDRDHRRCRAGDQPGQRRQWPARWRLLRRSGRRALPDVPTMKEAGADVEAVLWSGIFVPAATPPEIVSKLEAEFIRIARLPDVVSRLKLLNIDSVGNSSEEFSRIIAADLERWKAVARAGNIKMAQ